MRDRMEGWLTRLFGIGKGSAWAPAPNPFPVTPASVQQVIPLDLPNRSGHAPFFVGDRQRLATATGVRFLDRDRLLASHLVGQRLCLLRRAGPGRPWTVAFSVPTTFRGSPACTDTLDCSHAGMIVTSNCNANSISFYRLEGDRILHHADVDPPNGERGFCHGVKFLPGGAVACATCTSGGRHVSFFSVPDGALIYRFNDEDWRPKDTCFVNARRMLVFFSRGNATPEAGQPFESKISLVDLDLVRRRHRVRSETFIDRCHFDCGTFRAGRVYTNNQLRDTVVVMELRRNRLVQVAELGGFRFPHGLDVLPEENLMAVTNYGTSDILVCQL